MKTILIIISIFATSLTSAQVPFLEQSLKPVPELNSATPLSYFIKIDAALAAPSPAPLAIDVAKIAATLDSQFKKALLPLQSAEPACSSAAASDYALALRVAGRYQDCSDYATKCAQDSKVSSLIPVLTGALCEATLFHYAKADHFFDLATHAKFSSSEDFSEAIYLYASYAAYGIHEDQVDSILNLNTVWTSTEKKLWKGVIHRAGRLDLDGLTKPEVDQFLELNITKGSTTFTSLLKSLKMGIQSSDMKYPLALKTLEAEAASFTNPLHWYSLAYSILYFGLDQKFAEARAVYDVYDQYSNPWFEFPSEHNTYNYTEIYKKICTASLLPASEAFDFQKFKNKIRNGQILPQAALQEIQTWVQKFPKKADVLTTYGGLLAMNNQHEKAFDSYWQAHRECRYYNRANWGLILEKRFLKYSQRPDYKTLAASVDTALAGLKIPAEISQYFSNWNSLEAELQKRVQYGARIWLPYMADLSKNNLKAYIKYSFDLLSDSPNMSNIKDKRIGGPNYPNDNRLWDDVRGVGGDHVVADLAEVFQTVQGDYNLLGHEMTHQFQTYLRSASRIGFDCVIKLYDQAKLKNNFPDTYASYNDKEHFAQGITYYLIPSSAPKKFGLNRSWLENNNPDLLQFIQSIENSNGDLSQLKCAI